MFVADNDASNSISLDECMISISDEENLCDLSPLQGRCERTIQHFSHDESNSSCTYYISPSSVENHDVYLRYLCEEDVDSIKTLCKDIFPVDYPDYWYNDVTSDPSLWSMAAVCNQKIVGVCIAEVKRLNNCNAEDRNILSKKFPANTPVCYMLSLGVDKACRRRGVASMLLDQLLAYIRNTSTYGANGSPIRALYLHVLATNFEAISFYERRKFRRHSRQFGYYNINGCLHDGYSYVLYLNGGHPALSISSAIISCGSLFVKPWRLLWNLLLRAASRSRQ